jgi:hypothetical protein
MSRDTKRKKIFLLVRISNFMRFRFLFLIGNWYVCELFITMFRDEKRNLRFPCIQWERNEIFFFVPTVYKGNANFVFRP